MTVTASLRLDNIEGPSENKTLAFVYAGAVTLVAGAATDQLPAGMSGPPVALLQRVVVGGALGHLTSSYDIATGALTITSSSATETSTIVYFMVKA